MKTPTAKYLNIIRAWLKKAMNLIKALSLSLKNQVSMLVKRNISKVKEWFGKNRQNLVMTICIIAIMYSIPYTFMLENKERTVIGIILQILVGAILVFGQISSSANIKKQVTEIIQKPPLFALLITVILFPFAISILTGLNEVPSNRWSSAGGIAFFVFITYAMFLTSLMFLRRIKWLRRKDYLPAAKDRLEVSDLSLRNVWILFGASVLIMILLSYLLYWLSPHKELWIQIVLIILFLSYGFTLFPLLIISPLYFIAFGFAKFAFYIRNNNLGVWFWIFLFILWTWGGLLLIVKEFT
jgi:hypothetical protein